MIIDDSSIMSSWNRSHIANICQLKKKFTTLTLRGMFYSADKTEDLSLGHSISDNSKGLFWRGRNQDIQKVLQQRPGSWNIKRRKERKWSRSVVSDSLWLHKQGFSVHGVFQARILEWVAISFSRGSSSPRDWIQVSRIAGNIKRLLLIKECQISWVKELSPLLCLGRCKSLTLVKSTLWNVPQLSGVSILCSGWRQTSSWVSLGYIIRGGCCYDRCPNPRAGREKASKTMQLAKKRKFITDSSQGFCRNQRSGAGSEKAPSPSCYPDF